VSASTRASRAALAALALAILAGFVAWIGALASAPSRGPLILNAAAVAPVGVPALPQQRSVRRRQVDPRWLATVSAASGIPSRALSGYASAQLTVAQELPACGLGWNTLAAIGAIESGHGTHDGSVLDAAGWAEPRILGPTLDGTAFAAVPDTDGGAFDGDTRWDRAVGPLQFIPSAWATWGADGNGDGRRDPDQIDDAALAAARYLCHAGNLADPATWRAAVRSYNHSEVYVDDVVRVATDYARLAGDESG
jgi:membrane-bound lytic murein transglycosylase B